MEILQIITVCLLLQLTLKQATSFQITKCESDSIPQERKPIANKNTYEITYSEPYRITKSSSFKIWCHADCWISKCALTHPDTNYPPDCILSADGKHCTDDRDRNSAKIIQEKGGHVCKFTINKIQDEGM